MKKIALSCSGEGRGHVSRVLALSKPLKRKGYELSFWCPETVSPLLRNAHPDAEIINVPLLALKKNRHTIDYPGTLRANAEQIKGRAHIITGLAFLLSQKGIAALISDFEPFTVHAAHRSGIPVLNLNHPGIVRTHFSLRSEALAARAVARLMMPRAQETILCSFYNGHVGPIIREEIGRLTPQEGDFHLVYLKPEFKEGLTAALNRFPGEAFRCYPNPQGNFLQDLAECRSVIAPAGHQMISEALVLGKPVLAFPQRGQYEQKLNAKMVALSGRGLHGDAADPVRGLEEFLNNLDRFPGKPARGIRFSFRDSTAEAVSRIENFLAAYGASPGRYAFSLPVSA